MATETSPADGRRGLLAGQLARRRASHSYGFVLLLIIASFAFIALAPEERWARAVLAAIQSATLAAALWTSGFGRTALVATLGLMAIASTAAVLALVASDDTSIPTLGVINAVLVVAAGVVIAIGVADQGDVNAQTVLGAICVYMQIGMFFTFAYTVIIALSSEPFFANGTDGTLAIVLYFSYVTLTTVGYGDYTAAGDLGRAMAALESLVGQLYLVTVVAVIVGLMVGKRRTPR